MLYYSPDGNSNLPQRQLDVFSEGLVTNYGEGGGYKTVKGACEGGRKKF